MVLVFLMYESKPVSSVKPILSYQNYSHWNVYFISILSCELSLWQDLYESSLPEDVPINKGILTVVATDNDIGTNADIQYSLFGIGVEDFYMDASTGIHQFTRSGNGMRTPRLFFICLFVLRKYCTCGN